MITFESNEGRRVYYFPRTEADEPRVETHLTQEDSAQIFEEDLLKPANSVPELTRTVAVTGIAAEVVARMWTRHREVAAALAAEAHPDRRIERWARWSAGVLAMHNTTEIVQIGENAVLLGELNSISRAGVKMTKLSIATLGLLREREQLYHLNGSTPAAELLPLSASALPTELLGAVTGDISLHHA